MGNVNQRNMLAEMGQAFKDWADSYFDINGDHVDTMVPKEDALKDFIDKTNTKGWSTNKFTKALLAWCRFYGHKFNPKAFQNSQKRISRKVDGVTKDMVYIQTRFDKELSPEHLDDNAHEVIPEEDRPF